MLRQALLPCQADPLSSTLAKQQPGGNETSMVLGSRETARTLPLWASKNETLSKVLNLSDLQFLQNPSHRMSTKMK